MSKRRKTVSRRKMLILAIDLLLVVAVVVCAVILIVNLSGKKQPAAAQPPAAAGDPVQAQADVQPSGAPVSGMRADAVDFESLTARGIDAVGYLFSNGTPINYPVVQYTENEYYMEHAPNGKKDKNGAIYLDCRNAKSLGDSQLMIYGNPMADGTMFGSLVSYRDQAYLDAHPTLTFVTPEQTYTIHVFAAHTASPDMTNYPTWFTDAETRQAYIDGVRAKSSVQSVLTVEPYDKLVSLVTSSDFESGDNSRFVVHGVLRAD